MLQSLLRGEAYCFAVGGNSAGGRPGSAETGASQVEKTAHVGVGLSPMLGVCTSKSIHFGPGYVKIGHVLL